MRDVRLCLAGFIADFMLIIRPESGRRVILGRNKRSNSVYAKKERQTEPSAMRHLCHSHVVSPLLFSWVHLQLVCTLYDLPYYFVQENSLHFSVAFSLSLSPQRISVVPNSPDK